MEAEGNDVWDYFDKHESDEIGVRRAKCRICENVYNYSTTIHNLKTHLLKKHSITVETHTQPTVNKPKERRKRSAAVWTCFTQVPGKEKFASCHYCDKVLSFLTTTNNLKTHLRNKHPDAFMRLQQNLPSDVAYVEEYLESEEEEADNSNDSAKETPEWWDYFENENATSSICAVCCATVPNKLTDKRQHLITKHPKLLGEYMSQDSDQNDEVFSEVIYLEENPKTKEQKIKVKKIQKMNFDGYSKPKKRRFSQEMAKKSVEMEEIETFGSYITCLMKQLPRDVCSNVQRDIINIILNAKTQDCKKETQQKLIKDIIKEMNGDDDKRNGKVNDRLVTVEGVVDNDTSVIKSVLDASDEKQTEDVNTTNTDEDVNE